MLCWSMALTQGLQRPSLTRGGAEGGSHFWEMLPTPCAQQVSWTVCPHSAQQQACSSGQCAPVRQAGKDRFRFKPSVETGRGLLLHAACRTGRLHSSEDAAELAAALQEQGLCEKALRTYELGRAARMQTMTRVEMVSPDTGSPYAVGGDTTRMMGLRAPCRQPITQASTLAALRGPSIYRCLHCAASSRHGGSTLA